MEVFGNKKNKSLTHVGRGRSHGGRASGLPCAVGGPGLANFDGASPETLLERGATAPAGNRRIKTITGRIARRATFV